MSKNPAPLPLQIELLAAAENHPEHDSLDRMLASGDWCLRSISARQFLRHPTDNFIVFRLGALLYKFRNCPARLRQLAEVIGKSRGFNGKRTMRDKLSMAGCANIYKHADGFQLAIPDSMQRSHYSNKNPTSQFTLGRVTLTLHHGNRTITGRVPDSWLIDLNGPHPDDEITAEARTAGSSYDLAETLNGLDVTELGPEAMEAFERMHEAPMTA